MAGDEKVKTTKTGEVTVRGKKYRLQHPGAKWYLRHTDKSRDRNGVIQSLDYIQGLFDNVVIDPAGLKTEDFESVGELEALVTEIEQFLRG